MERSTRSRSTREHWIVDGYNVLRVSLSGEGPAQWWSEDRRTVLGEIASRLPRSEAEITLVFDARHLAEPSVSEPASDTSRRGERPVVRHVYAPSADEWIVGEVKAEASRQSGALARMVVVTADRPLADRVRHRGAEVVATDEFVALCGGPQV